MQSGIPRFLKSRYAPWLTHLSLAVLTIFFFALLILVPFRIAFVPGVLIGHRIGVLLHEYFHGIPFRRYRHNLAVISFFDGLLLMFGMLELFRGTHLAHHRWLNSELDSARETASRTGGKRLLDLLAATEAVQHLVYLSDALRGRKPYVRGWRLLLGAILSTVTILVWLRLGYSEVVWKTLIITVFTTLVPVSLRGAVEHHSYAGDPNFANEYRVWIPLFNLNRHIHHHEEPTLPWYLLEFRTEKPLAEWNYFTYWFRVYVRRDLVLMQPMPEAAAIRRASRGSDSRPRNHDLSGRLTRSVCHALVIAIALATAAEAARADVFRILDDPHEAAPMKAAAGAAARQDGTCVRVLKCTSPAAGAMD